MRALSKIGLLVFILGAVGLGVSLIQENDISGVTCIILLVVSGAIFCWEDE